MAFLRRKPKTPDRLTSMLGDTDVPVFRELTLRILDRLREPEVDFVQVSEALQWDPGLVAQVLRTVNSAAYGPSSQIMDVRHAVSYMGRSALEQIVTALAVKQALPSTPALGYEPREFWTSAGTRAALARQIAGQLHPASEAEVFTAGLLSDLAVPLLAHGRPQTYGRVLKAWQGERSGDLADFERSAFGWDHGQVGGELARHWALPDALVASIHQHHSPVVDDSTLAPALRLVALLQQTESERDTEQLVEVSRQEYGLQPDWMLEALEQSRLQGRELTRAMA